LIAFLDAFKAIRSFKARIRALKPKVFKGVGAMPHVGVPPRRDAAPRLTRLEDSA
jgi:hypothetical protein